MYLLRVKGGNRRGRGPNKCDTGQNRSESVSPIHPWKSMSTRVLQCQRLEREKSPDYISARIFVHIYCFWQLFTKLCESMDWMSRQEEAKPVSAALVVTGLGKIHGWSLEAPSLNKLNHLQINSKSAALLGFFQPAFQVANTEIFKKSCFLHFEYSSGHGKA